MNQPMIWILKPLICCKSYCPTIAAQCCWSAMIATFLDRVVSMTLAVEEGGQWLSYAGGYSDMLEQRKLVAKEQKASAKVKEPKGCK